MGSRHLPEVDYFDTMVTPQVSSPTVAERLGGNDRRLAVEWGRAYGSDFARAYAECPDYEWLAILASSTGVGRERVEQAQQAAVSASGVLTVVAPVPGAIQLVAPAARWVSRSRRRAEISQALVSTYLILNLPRLRPIAPRPNAAIHAIAADVFRRELPLEEVLVAERRREGRFSSR